jgi:putative PIN family toxin of toxin-antitoxin system
VRAVLDTNVLISALLAPQGAPASIITRWLDGAFELVVSEALLGELAIGLSYPRLRRRVHAEAGAVFVELLRESARIDADPADVPKRSRDPADDYLLALAESARAILVTGDRDLLELGAALPVQSPRDFLERLGP